MENRRQKSNLILLGVLVASVILVAVSPLVTGMLQFDRQAINDGQLWRLFTGHYTHWNWDHLIWDALALIIGGLICLRISRAHTFIMLIASPLALSGFMIVFHPEVDLYRGLSGLGCTLAAYATLHFLTTTHHEKNWKGFLFFTSILLAFLVKTFFEQVVGMSFFVHTDAFVTMPTIHCAGAFVGMIVYMPSKIFRKRHQTAVNCSA